MLHQRLVTDVGLVDPTLRPVLQEQAGLHLVQALIRCNQHPNMVNGIEGKWYSLLVELHFEGLCI